MNTRSIWFYLSLFAASGAGYGVSAYTSPSQAEFDRAIASAANMAQVECTKPNIAQAKGAFRNSRDSGL